MKEKSKKIGFLFLNAVAVLAAVWTFMPYIMLPYPCEMKTIDFVVQPTDIRGRLEYCVFSAEWNGRAYQYTPLTPQMCGAVKSELVHQAELKESAMVAANAKCQQQLPTPLQAWTMWFNKAKSYVATLKG